MNLFATLLLDVAYVDYVVSGFQSSRESAILPVYVHSRRGTSYAKARDAKFHGDCTRRYAGTSGSPFSVPLGGYFCAHALLPRPPAAIWSNARWNPQERGWLRSFSEKLTPRGSTRTRWNQRASRIVTTFQPVQKGRGLNFILLKWLFISRLNSHLTDDDSTEEF